MLACRLANHGQQPQFGIDSGNVSCSVKRIASYVFKVPPFCTGRLAL